MSILVNSNTRLLVQGMTGKEGSHHARLCKVYGTRVVAGVTPGKGGKSLDGIPVFNTVKEAVQKESVNTSMIFVPAPFAGDAILEAIDAELDFVVCITEGIPVRDTMKIKKYLQNKKTRLLGPNCPGIVSATMRIKVGIIPAAFVTTPGRLGVMSRSGSLSYETVYRLSKAGLGQSACLGIGGDPVVGMTFADCLALFEKDPDTDAMVISGEIGGTTEEEAAEYIKKYVTKPVVAYVCGLTAPPGKVMGHAGAIISGNKGSTRAKLDAFKSVGVETAENMSEIVEKVNKVLKQPRH